VVVVLGVYGAQMFVAIAKNGAESEQFGDGVASVSVAAEIDWVRAALGLVPAEIAEVEVESDAQLEIFVQILVVLIQLASCFASD